MKIEDYNEYYVQGSDHYLIPKYIFRELLSKNQELAKINEEHRKLNGELREEIKKLENQQKEFIKYLEDESKKIYRDGGLRQNIFRQILQKYKSIIGERI